MAKNVTYVITTIELEYVLDGELFTDTIPVSINTPKVVAATIADYITPKILAGHQVAIKSRSLHESGYSMPVSQFLELATPYEPTKRARKS